MKIKLSIITATYNSAKTLPATLASLENQTNQNFESIVVDGGSKDSTLEIVQNSSVVDRWVSEKDRGIYDALNKGIAMSEGEYVGFMHSDDVFASDSSVAEIMSCLDKYKPEALYGNLQYVQKDDVSKVIRLWESGNYSFSRLRYGWMPPHPTFYMKKDLYDRIGGFDLSYSIAADYDSLLRYLYTNNVTPVYLDRVLVNMRMGGASNRSLKNIIQKSKEDARAMRSAGIPVFAGLFCKNFSKLPQFIRK